MTIVKKEEPSDRNRRALFICEITYSKQGFY